MLLSRRLRHFITPFTPLTLLDLSEDYAADTCFINITSPMAADAFAADIADTMPRWPLMPLLLSTPPASPLLMIRDM